MPPRTITLCYRKLIDATATAPWDRLVLADTYAELRLQAQTFDPGQRYRTFAELVQHAPGADKLHFLVSAAVRGYVQQLGGWVPDVVDNLERQFLRFTQFQFELVNSDLRDPARHQVAVNFYTEPLRWHDTVGPYLLVSAAAGAPAAPGGEVLTHTFQLQPGLAIHALHPGASRAPSP